MIQETPPSEDCATAHFFLAINIASLTSVENFKATVDRQIYMTRQAKPRKGFYRIVLPGEIEWELTQKRRVDGIPLHKSQLQMLKELTDEFGVRVSWQLFLTDNSASAKT